MVSKMVKVNIMAGISYSTFRSNIQHDFLLPNKDEFSGIYFLEK